MNEWQAFLDRLRDTGGSKDMQTSKTGRYPWLFHFCRGQAHLLFDVVIYAGRGIISPPRDWRTEAAIKADYAALKEHGGFFNDTTEALGESPSPSPPVGA